MKYMMAAVFALLFTVAGSGCARQEIRTDNATENEIAGTYSLIVCSDWYGSDLVTVAVLSKEDAPYALVPYGPDFNCSITKHQAAKDALAEAAGIIRRNPDVAGTQLGRITDISGKVLGYEVRPVYRAFRYGSPDIFETFYWRENDKVFFKIWFLPREER
ncbi:MAG: hypothetical protein HQL08_12465 [Nitrospirae bacterium]|nr:hypothetical protein [Nitrospirota bacterium]